MRKDQSNKLLSIGVNYDNRSDDEHQYVRLSHFNWHFLTSRDKVQWES